MKTFSIANWMKRISRGPVCSLMRRDSKNQRLLDAILARFEDVMEQDSTRRRLLYPMAFTVVMTQEDFNEHQPALCFILPGLIDDFHESIARHRKGRDATPPSKSWYFQFSPCIDEVAIEGFKVERGNPIIISQLYNPDALTTGNVGASANTYASVGCLNSDMSRCAGINLDAISGIDMLSEGVFTWPFETRQSGLPTGFNGDYATLAYSTGRRNITYTMLDTVVDISGAGDPRRSRAVFKLESRTICNSHVQVKYDTDKRQFFIAAFAKTLLNETPLPISYGSNIHWHPLPNNSDIFVGDEISITFKRNV